jgi:hypothetical protein
MIRGERKDGVSMLSCGVRDYPQEKPQMPAGRKRQFFGKTKTVRLDIDDEAKLKALADLHRTDVSTIIREAIAEKYERDIQPPKTGRGKA